MNTNCPMAEKKDPTFELLKLDQGNVIKDISTEDIMVFVIIGKIDLSIDISVNTVIKADDIIYLPIDCHYLAHILEDSTLLIVRIHDPILFCNCLRDYVPHLLFCQLDAPFDRWNSVLCRHIRSDLPRCLGNSVFCVEKED